MKITGEPGFVLAAGTTSVALAADTELEPLDDPDADDDELDCPDEPEDDEEEVDPPDAPEEEDEEELDCPDEPEDEEEEEVDPPDAPEEEDIVAEPDEPVLLTSVAKTDETLGVEPPPQADR